MGEGARVLDELMRAQAPHVADPRHHARALVGGELLVAIDREAFLQAELEPVAAGDAVAGPVVEVLVGDDRLDRDEIAVGRGRERGQHVLVVEDVEALVLHRAHVEVGHRDHHEDVEIVFAAERLLVPAHRALERVHGVAGAVLLAGLHIDAERDLAAGLGDERVLGCGRACRRPARRDRRASATGRATPRNAGRREARRYSVRLPLASSTGASAPVRLDARGVDRHHVRPVGVIGDAAEALGLALRAVVAARAVEAGELGVGLRIDQCLDLQRERPVRRLRDGEAARASRDSGRRQASRRRSSATPASARRRPAPSGAGAPAAGLGLSFSVARTGVCVG